MSEYIEIACIMGVHGVRGDVKVKVYNPDSKIFVAGNTVYLKIKQEFKPYKIKKVSKANKGLVVHFFDIEDRDYAREFFKFGIFVERDSFPKIRDDEFFVVDLIGMKMIDDKSGEDFGEITGVMETGASDLYIVEKGTRELLVPIISGLVKDIDYQQKTVSVVLLEGLLDLYED